MSCESAICGSVASHKSHCNPVRTRACREPVMSPHSSCFHKKIGARKDPGIINWLARSPGHCPGCSELSRRAMFLEALPAIYRTALGGLERYLAVFPAVRALRVVHLSGATKAPASASFSVSVTHVLTLYFLTSPSRTMFAYCAPLRERHCSNHLPRWFVCEHINLLVSKHDPQRFTGRGTCSPGARGQLWL